MSEVSNRPSVPKMQMADMVAALTPCAHDWVHMPERDWVSGLHGHRVLLLFFCRRCLAVETRKVERQP